MNKYNDGLNNETEVQIISTYRRPISQNIDNDLGTLVNGKNTNSNLNYNIKCNENMNMKENTFRQNIVENGCAPEVRICPEKSLVAEPQRDNVVGFGCVMAAQPKNTKKGFKRLNHNAIYNEINVQVSNVRDEGRYMRCRIHVSLKETTDKQYSVFLSGAATTSKHELHAGAKGNIEVLRVIDDFMNRRPGCMIARFHYKPVKGFITDFHRKNLKSAIMMIYENIDIIECELYLMGEYITIPLDKELTKKQKEYYSLAGLYRMIPDQMTDEEEFDDEV